jgi:hypothetical protein
VTCDEDVFPSAEELPLLLTGSFPITEGKITSVRPRKTRKMRAGTWAFSPCGQQAFLPADYLITALAQPSQ